MLDIKYFKQIDEVLEVEKFKLNRDKTMLIYPCGSSIDLEYIEQSLDNGLFRTTNYPLYLQRVRNAINKKYRTESFFYYRIIQTDDKIMPCKTVDSLEDYLLSKMTEDEALEKSIALIMDHIKEKV